VGRRRSIIGRARAFATSLGTNLRLRQAWAHDRILHGCLRLLHRTSQGIGSTTFYNLIPRSTKLRKSITENFVLSHLRRDAIDWRSTDMAGCRAGGAQQPHPALSSPPVEGICLYYTVSGMAPFSSFLGADNWRYTFSRTN
jgi:hypothetical protein